MPPPPASSTCALTPYSAQSTCDNWYPAPLQRGWKEEVRTMTTFVLLSKVAAESVKRVKNLPAMDKAFERKLKEQCPEVKRIASL